MKAQGGDCMCGVEAEKAEQRGGGRKRFGS